MISKAKYYQLKAAVKHRIFGEEVHNYRHYTANQHAKNQRSDVAKTIIYGREIKAAFICNVT
jgi:hypothetical protein